MRLTPERKAEIRAWLDPYPDATRKELLDAFEELEAEIADLTRLARAQGIREAADAITAKHHSDFQIGVCRAREVVLTLLDRDAQEALVEDHRKVRLEEAEWWSKQYCRHSPLINSERYCAGCQRLTELRAAAREGQAEASPEGRDGK